MKVWRFDVATEAGAEVESESCSTIGSGEREGVAVMERVAMRRLTAGQTFTAWMPFILLCVLMTAVGVNKKAIDAAPGTVYEMHMPGLDKQVRRTPPVVETVTMEAAVFRFNWEIGRA